eukprot:6323884-Amphidinium_carterae.2
MPACLDQPALHDLRSLSTTSMTFHDASTFALQVLPYWSSATAATEEKNAQAAALLAASLTSWLRLASSPTLSAWDS